MKVILFVAFFGFCSWSNIWAQETCSGNLNIAVHLFQRGDFYGVPRVLKKHCLVSPPLSDIQIKRGYKVLIESYKAIDYDDEAEELYSAFKSYIRNSSRARTDSAIQQIYDAIEIIY